MAILSFGVMKSFYGILICRFLSGLFSNSQLAIRKFLFNIILQQKGDWSKQSRKALWSFRLGIITGIGITSFLINPADFLPVESKFVQNRFLLGSLIVFLLEISGILLVFSIDSALIVSQPKKYIELPEIKEDAKKKENDDEQQTKEKFEMENYLHSSVLGNEHIPSEESVGPEDVKFYSPRSVANRPITLRTIHSARPKVDISFNFSGATSETREHIPQEGEGKRTHISFIEDEFDNIPEIQQPRTEKEIIPPSSPKIKAEPHLKFAYRYRFACTARS